MMLSCLEYAKGFLGGKELMMSFIIDINRIIIIIFHAAMNRMALHAKCLNLKLQSMIITQLYQGKYACNT